VEPTVIPIFLASFAIGFTGAASPGPLLAYTITGAARLGFAAGPLVSTGHAVLELFVVIGLAFGLAALAEIPAVAITIGLLGGGVLVYMGIDLLRGLPRMSLTAASPGRAVDSRLGAVAGGAVVTLSNPFWFLWWLTAGAAAFLDFGAAAGVAGIIAFYLGHIASDYGWYSFVAGVVAAGRRWMTDPVYRGLLAVCALFLAGMGGWFILNAATSLLGQRPQ
jgi:threonine/homoserine/homoserine lactone efflux protein